MDSGGNFMSAAPEHGPQDKTFALNATVKGAIVKDQSRVKTYNCCGMTSVAHHYKYTEESG